ncbi:hypothetical protein GCM10022204_41500 [Microlunatus aurantiacus]|uniref:Uncharacterized protein n=1 Tax=Microlunatus aurantiacus TaxID=446786 RepID=A0ABP7EHJ0_9ACTN
MTGDVLGGLANIDHLRTAGGVRGGEVVEGDVSHAVLLSRYPRGYTGVTLDDVANIPNTRGGNAG